MAKEARKTNSSEQAPLPYDATAENIEKVIDAIKRKPGDEASIKAICSFVGFNVTKRALESLKIISGYTLAELGQKIAYSTNGKNEFYLDAIMAYPPYELFLTNLHAKTGGFDSSATADTIKNFWGLNKFGNTESNRERAVATFGNFTELAGLGKLVVGRGKNPTRIEWVANAFDVIEGYQQIPNEQKGTLDPQIDVSDTVTDNMQINTKDVLPQNNAPTLPATFNLNNTSSYNAPHITIEVNMSDWDTDKIKLFFKYAYGDFSDDRKEKD